MIELTIVRDQQALADLGAAITASILRSTLAGHDTASLALSGGRTPRRMLEGLARQPDLEWGRVTVFQVDERDAPTGHGERNLTMLEEALLHRITARAVHPMPVDGDLTSGAHAYAAQLPAVLDLVVLGLGADGHTASLVPGDAALAATNDTVAVTQPYQGRHRLTLTTQPLRRAHHQLWLVAGGDKRAALGRLLAADPGVPAAAVIADDAKVLADLDAVRR